MQSDIEKVRKSVSMAVTRAIKAVEKRHVAFGTPPDRLDHFGSDVSIRPRAGLGLTDVSRRDAR